MSDWFERKIKATDKVRKLIRHAQSTNNPEEQGAYMARAAALATEYEINIATLAPGNDVELTPEQKRAKARQAFAKFGGVLKKAAPDNDREDYTGFEKERKERLRDRDRKEIEDLDDDVPY